MKNNFQNEWSENLKSLTRKNAGCGSAVKNLGGKFGMIVQTDGKVVINSVGGKYWPEPTDEKIAEYENIEKMIEAGWVID